MKIRNHALVYYIALTATNKLQLWENNIAWLLLPDCIRLYSGSRKFSHHEVSVDGESASWLKYPDLMELKNLNSSNPKLEMFSAETRGDTVRTKFHPETLLEINGAHPMYALFKLHLTQDSNTDDLMSEELKNYSFSDYEDYIQKFATIRFDLRFIENIVLFLLKDLINIPLNDEWITKILNPSLEEHYSTELFEDIQQYLLFDEEELRVLSCSSMEEVLSGEVFKDISFSGDLAEKTKSYVSSCITLTLQEVLDM